MTEQTKACPECGETILAVAKRCKHCQADLGGASQRRPSDAPNANKFQAYDDVPWYRKNWFALVCGLFFTPALLPVLLTGNVYYQRKGELRRYSIFARVLLLCWSAAVTLAVARDIYTIAAKSDVATVGANLGVPAKKQEGTAATASSSQTSASSTAPAITVGDQFKTANFEMQVASKTTSVLGDSHASKGTIYVAVLLRYKNIGSTPVTAPSIYLVDPSGTKYDTDAGASMDLVTQTDSNMNTGAEDINPGISQTDAAAFHVSTEMFNPHTWHILISADEEIPVGFKPAEQAAGDATAAAEGAAGGSVASAAVVESTDMAAPVAAAASPAVDPPVAGSKASFDCSKASSRAEHLICDNASLAKADTDMANFYKQNLVAAQTANPNGVSAIKAGQRAFLAKRDSCADAPCVQEMYRARWEELAQMGYVRE